MTTNIVVLGGSFNPFGKHHLRVLQELDARDQFDLILVVPSAAHPLKMFDEGTALSHSDLIPVEHRIAMARLGLIESGIRTHVAVSELEKQLAERSGGPVYTWDLLCDLRKRCDQGDAQLNIRFAIGPDIRSELHRWKYVSEIEKHFGFIDVETDGVRATDIRRMIREGDEAWVDLVATPAEALYIRHHHLYQDELAPPRTPQRNL